jgi:hypothetical protein
LHPEAENADDVIDVKDANVISASIVCATTDTCLGQSWAAADSYDLMRCHM